VVCGCLCRYGFLALVFSGLSLLPMSCFLYMELCTIAAYGWGWMRAWNVMDMVSARACAFVRTLTARSAQPDCLRSCAPALSYSAATHETSFIHACCVWC
jgi:hypothetical protein